MQTLSLKSKIFLWDRYENFFNQLYIVNLVKVGTRTIQFNISRRIDVTSNKSWLPEDPVNRGLDAPPVTMHASVYPFKDSPFPGLDTLQMRSKRVLISASRESPLYTRHATVSRKCLMLTVVRHVWASLKFARIIYRVIKWECPILLQRWELWLQDLEHWLYTNFNICTHFQRRFAQ